MDTRSELQATVDAMVQPGKGLLAADESGPTIAKRFKTIGLDSTEENRRAYRNLLLTTPGLGEFVSGVILYEETLGQKADNGTPDSAVTDSDIDDPTATDDTGRTEANPANVSPVKTEMTLPPRIRRS